MIEGVLDLLCSVYLLQFRVVRAIMPVVLGAFYGAEKPQIAVLAAIRQYKLADAELNEILPPRARKISRAALRTAVSIAWQSKREHLVPDFLEYWGVLLKGKPRFPLG